MELVALISAYKEGPLVHGAIESALTATERVIVFEGPAGEPLEGCPETDYGRWDSRIELREGAWKTDARKRTAMVEACRTLESPAWAVWVDGDEILRNGDLLVGWLQHFTWQDEHEQARDPDALPSLGWPIRLVELDGSIAVCRGKVVRVDLIDSYSVSSSVFKTALGITHGEGNIPERFSEGFGPMLKTALDLDRMIVPPWLFGMPWLLHRSRLRHPARTGLRMHEQEAVEIERAKLAGSGA